MTIHAVGISHAKQVLRWSLSIGREGMPTKTPKGHIVVYVGEEEKNRHMVPMSYLNEPLFQDLLSKAKEEFGYDHPMGGLTIPCTEEIFVDLISQLS